MKKIRVFLMSLALILVLPFSIAFAFAANMADTEEDITVSLKGAYAYETPPGAQTAAVFVHLKNTGNGADTLKNVVVDAKLADRAELHTMDMQDGVMKMRRVEGLSLPVSAETKLSPTGNHIMLMGLKEPLKKGDSFTITLDFEVSGDLVHVDVPVYAIGEMPMQEEDKKKDPRDDHGGHDHGHHHGHSHDHGHSHGE